MRALWIVVVATLMAMGWAKPHDGDNEDSLALNENAAPTQIDSSADLSPILLRLKRSPTHKSSCSTCGGGGGGGYYIPKQTGGGGCRGGGCGGGGYNGGCSTCGGGGSFASSQSSSSSQAGSFGR